jgi:peptide chain release factor 2
VASPDLWDDNNRAQTLLKERTELRARLESISRPWGQLEDVALLIELGELEDDESVEGEIEGTLARVEAHVSSLEFKRMLGRPFDRSDAILTINAGAGGTESLDWAGMLLRMYIRFCDSQGWSVSFLDRQDGDEAGIKSASLSISGAFSYGMLRAEAGVHRLVRISPFDASARRHTSFAACFVYPDVEDLIEIEVNEVDLRVDTYRASGAGGQHVNKTNSAVRITHLPSGIVVQSQSQRSQHQNRAAAMKVLKARLYELERAIREEERSAVESAKQEIAFGSQIRNYVMHPYQLVKDVRTNLETSNVDAVLDGALDPFIKAFLIANPSQAE